jgi:hypothetical protein
MNKDNGSMNKNIVKIYVATKGRWWEGESVNRF